MTRPIADSNLILHFGRADFSELHAYEARQAFVKNIMNGEASLDLADAAFQIAAEDDALVSHSSVKLPVQSYSKRLQRMAEEIARHRLGHMSLVGSDRDPHAVMQVKLAPGSPPALYPPRPSFIHTCPLLTACMWFLSLTPVNLRAAMQR